VPLQVGFIGCGGIARVHAKQLQDIRGARIVACADIVAKAAEAFAADFGADEVHTDFRRMVKSDRVQAVLVCVPTGLHKSAVLAAARAGKDVFCEKPLAMKVADARAMAEACRKARVKLTVGFVRRFCNEWDAMRRLVTSGAIGRPIVWHSVFHGPGPRIAWFNDAAMGGGPLLDGAIHNYDFALQMCGPAAVVLASGHTWNKKNTGQDTVSAIVRFRSGDDLMMSWSWGMPERTIAGCLHQLVGPKGTIGWDVPKKLLPKGFDPKRQGALLVTGPGNKQRAVVYKTNNMFGDQMKHVVRQWAGGKQPLVTGADGITSLVVGDAVLKSAKSLRSIRL